MIGNEYRFVRSSLIMSSPFWGLFFNSRALGSICPFVALIWQFLLSEIVHIGNNC